MSTFGPRGLRIHLYSPQLHHPRGSTSNHWPSNHWPSATASFTRWEATGQRASFLLIQPAVSHWLFLAPHGRGPLSISHSTSGTPAVRAAQKEIAKQGAKIPSQTSMGYTISCHSPARSLRMTACRAPFEKNTFTGGPLSFNWCY